MKFQVGCAITGGAAKRQKKRMNFGSRLKAKWSVNEMDTILSAKRNVFILCCLKFADRVKNGKKKTKNNFILVFLRKES